MQEEELALTIKKALSNQETAPKQKHVRAMILYTWDSRGPGTLFHALHTYPILGDHVVAFKALVAYHKIIRQGHPQALKSQTSDFSWLDTILSTTSNHSSSSYSQLIKNYIAFLKTKLTYHRNHPYFSGTFDYEEYVSLKGIEDPNQGY